jgi:hypothetical protein
MEILEKSFVNWWKNLTPTEKDDTAIALSRKCNTALSTIQSWGLGYRTPRTRSQDIIVNFLAAKGIETSCKILFPTRVFDKTLT